MLCRLSAFMLRQLEIPSRLSHARAFTYANEMGLDLNNDMLLQALRDITSHSHSLDVLVWSLSQNGVCP